jgi:lipid-binding SYLF domain-containing protein
MRIVSLMLTVLVLAFAVPYTAAQNTNAKPPDPKAAKKQAEIDKKRTEVRKMSQDILQRLYKAQPLAQTAIKNSAGYAAFSNIGVNVLLLGSGKGQGLAINNKTQKETFMKMLEVQAGLGVGVKKFSIVFVFDNDKAFNGFVESGWQFGGQATAAAKTGDKGAAMAGAMSVSDGVWVSQLTDKGLALELTAKSTKYSKDDDLNQGL